MVSRLPAVEDSPRCPALKRSNQLIEHLFKPTYWRELCPSLSCSATERAHKSPRAKLSETRKLRCQQGFSSNGFFQLDKEEVGAEDQTINDLAVSVVQLLQYEWPATFIFMYDEVWQVIEEMRDDLKEISAGNEFVGDVYAWYVDPAKREKGWGPHRDRMGSGPSSFKAVAGKTCIVEEHGEVGPKPVDSEAALLPKLSTSWLALTKASPENSCLYVVPAFIDPFYHKQDRPEVNPLNEAFATQPDNYQYIRCLSCSAGSLNHFSHKIIHWGSSASAIERKVEPRIALSWVIGDDSFEQPCFSREHLPLPPFELRLGLICGQMISYSGQTQMKKGLRDLCFRIFKKVNAIAGCEFNEDYRDKVNYIYHMRPPPRKLALSKQTEASLLRTREVKVEDIEKATEEDNKQVVGIYDMFAAEGEVDSSEADSE